MTDTFDTAERSRIMACVRSTDTRPEMDVRHLVQALGYRYRLHVQSLPGRPDIVFPRMRKVIRVHGCFWHLHSCARGQRIPSSRRAYWKSKLEGNRRRDESHRRALSRRGWHVLTVWECQLRHPDRVASRIRAFLQR